MSKYLGIKRSQHSCDRYLLPSIVAMIPRNAEASARAGKYSSIAAAYLNGKLAGHIGFQEDGRFYSADRNKSAISLNSPTY